MEAAAPPPPAHRHAQTHRLERGDDADDAPPPRKKLVRAPFPQDDSQQRQQQQQQQQQHQHQQQQQQRESSPEAVADSPSRPPLQMTIKIDRALDADASSSEQTPKVTGVEDGSLKMTIKVPRHRDDGDGNGDDDEDEDQDRSDAERKRRRMNECSTPERLSVPKLTIKIPQEFDVRHQDQPRRSPVPKLTIKTVMKPEECSPTSRARRSSESPSPRTKSRLHVNDRPALASRAPDDLREDRSGTPSRLECYSGSLLCPVTRRSPGRLDDDSEPERPVEEVRETVPKLTIRPVPVVEEMNRPLEIETSPFRCTGQSESGQESPRIILKINKTFQGSTTEILTDKGHRKFETEEEEPRNANIPEPVVPKLTIRIPQENSEPTVVPCGSEPERNSPLGRIKLKLLKDGGCRKIVEEERDAPIETDGQTKTHSERDDGFSRVANDEVVTEAKRLKLEKFLSNSDLTVTRITKPRSELESLLISDSKPDVTVSMLSRGFSETDKTVVPTKKHNTRLTSPDVSILPNFLNRIRMKRDDKTPVTISRRNKRNSRFTASVLSADDALFDAHQTSSECPVFGTSDLIDLNEGSSSQECMIVDDLSQDPLDIDSIAKSHFGPVTIKESGRIIAANDSLVNINTGTPSDALAVPDPPRRGRGRPRKPRIECLPINSTIVSPVLDERNLRHPKRVARETVIKRTPRGRGRGRGGRRGAAIHNSHEQFSTKQSHLRSSNNTEPMVFFSNTSLFKDATMTKTKECSVNLKSSQVIDRLVNESDDASSDSDVSDGGRVSPMSENLADDSVSTPGRGRSRGRGARGIIRRPRGGRVIRGSRGATRGGTRNARGGIRCYDEIQLQDAMPTNILRKNRNKSGTGNTSFQLFEEETCMIGDNETPVKGDVILLDDDSRCSEMSSIVTENNKSKKLQSIEIVDNSNEWSAADVAEYDWPPEGCTFEIPPQTCMIQEQVAFYLGVKNFKAKYPYLHRRDLEPEEKKFLRDRGLVSSRMFESGVTAVDAGEILDIMFTDFPSKYEEYRQHLRENRDTRALNRPPAHLATERSKQETLERARESASSWNARLNRQRRTARSSAMDLQTLTLHRPRKPQPVASYSISSFYPVALLPGQFTDYYRSYTSEELRYFPLNTVLNIPPSPTRIEETGDSPSEESADESDAIDSSSDASESESSEKNFRRKNVSAKAKKAAVADTTLPGSSRPSSPTNGQSQTSAPPPPEVPRCKICSGTEHANRRYPTETFITCATCLKKVHPSCLEMASNVAKCVRSYAWQCADCKCCARCEDLADDDKMLFCDLCDRGYHIYCVGLKKVPTGRWHCSHCAICRSCGARTPTGLPGMSASLTPGPPEQWHHHLKKKSSGHKVYSHTLCGPCARAWRAGRYCSLCERCFIGQKGTLKVVICVNCDRPHHRECVRQPGRTLDVLNYMCNGCRRGNTPRKHFVPRKIVKKQPPNIIPISELNPVSNNSQRDVSMDISIDSICTNDSNHQSNSASCEGEFGQMNNYGNVTSSKIVSKKGPSPSKIVNNEIIDQKSNFTNLAKKVEPNVEKNPTNNHVENKLDNSLTSVHDKTNVNNHEDISNLNSKVNDSDVSSVVCKDISPMPNEAVNISQVSEVAASENTDVQKLSLEDAAINSVENCSDNKINSEISVRNDSLIFEHLKEKKIKENPVDIKLNCDSNSGNI